MATLLVHVGMHKTGTTHLQREVFPRMTGATFRHGGLVDELMRWLALAGDDAYDADLAAAAGAWLARGGEPVVVSWEGLSGHLWDDPVGVRARAACRIARLADDVHVLVAIRRQDAMLRAVYAQYVNEGGPIGARDFVRRAEVGELFDLRHLLYDDLVERYRSAVGPDRVHVLVHEAYRRDPAVLDELVSRAVGAHVPVHPHAAPSANPSLDGLGLHVLRRVNATFRRSKFVPEPPLPVGPARMARGILQGRASFLSRIGPRSNPWGHVPAAFRTEVRASNERLARLVPGLAAFGYPGAPPPAT